MNEFNNVQMKENQDPIVSDWDLHKFLQVKISHTQWFERGGELAIKRNR